MKKQKSKFIFNLKMISLATIIIASVMEIITLNYIVILYLIIAEIIIWTLLSIYQTIIDLLQSIDEKINKS